MQVLLGDSTISLTMDTYSHVPPNLQDEVVATMDALLGEAQSA